VVCLPGNEDVGVFLGGTVLLEALAERFIWTPARLLYQVRLTSSSIAVANRTQSFNGAPSSVLELPDNGDVGDFKFNNDIVAAVLGGRIPRFPDGDGQTRS
jgi:hypothetical protein